MNYRTNSLLIVAVIIIALIIISLVINDRLYLINLELYQNYKLNKELNKNDKSINDEIKELKNQLSDLQKVYNKSLNKNIPRMDDIRELTTRYNLKIRQIEEIRENIDKKVMYICNFTGSYKNIVYFTKHLENDFIFNFTDCSLRSIDESGDIIILTLKMEINQ